MTKDSNLWPPPIPGLEFDLEGPSADHLIDTSEIYDQPVYTHIHAKKEEWDIVSESEASPYLPKRKTPLSVIVGIEEKKEIELQTFGHIKLTDHFTYKKGYVINTGVNIWGLDFVPKLASVESDPKIQYLAVSGYRGSTEEHIGIDEVQPTGTYKNSIQIWKLKLSVHEQEDPFLDLCLLHDYGVIFDLKWCPYGTYEEQDVSNGLPKLGILSFTCGDATIRTIVVPHPDAVRRHMTDNHQTVYMKIKSSRATFAIAGNFPMYISWGGHKKIAAGCTTGTVVVWDMQSVLFDNQPKDADLSKVNLLLTMLVLDAAVSFLTWNGIKNPEKMVVGGYDGRTALIDINDPNISLTVMRSRNLMKTCVWASHYPTFLFTDNDNVARGFALNEDGTTSMLKYGETPGFCWDMASSEHHGQFALVTSLGWLRTSNLYQIKSRKLLISQVCAYKLDYSENTKKYRYIDGIGLQTMEESKKLPNYQQYGESFMALQKVVWNPNKRTSAFLASGGAAGLCRIEFEGRGSKWE